MRQDKRLVYFIIGFMMALLFTALTCKRGDRNGQPDSNDKVISDTVYVDRIVKVPGSSGSFVDSLPQPEVIYREDSELLKKYRELETENERMAAYIEAITIRSYEKQYTSLDGGVKITVKDSVTGTLDYQDVLFDIAPREVLVKERVVTNTIEKYPDFSISLGAGIKMPTTFQEPISFEGVIGIEDKKGYQYQFGVDTKREVRFTLSKKIFTKF